MQLMNLIRPLVLGVILAIVAAGCAVDRSTMATPEAFRDLAPPPEVAATSFCDEVAEDAGADEVAADTMTFDAPENVLDAEGKDYYACIVTNKGVIEVTLFDDNAPETVNSFVFLSQQGFYDGVLWHRVVPEFVIQGGDRNGGITGASGTGGPGYQYASEPGGLAITHGTAGTLSMAHRGAGTASNGSQFFITLDAACCNHLNGVHPVFGQVTGEGDMDIVLSVEQGDLIRTVQIIEVDAAS